MCFENKHVGNLMSLLAPVHSTSPNILKWNNNFSWTYKGEVADSMKERVKSKGGDVTGVLRFTIQWNEKGNDGSNDLDAHCKLPKKGHIYYGNKRHTCSGGTLDVDITKPSRQTYDGIAVENITWQNINKMPDGDYKFIVNNFSGANTDGFRAQIEMDGTIHEFSYNKPVTSNVLVGTVTLRDGKFTIKEGLSSSQSTKNVWGMDTQQFHKVNMVLNSPNHWDNRATGNKHYFFILEDCIQPGQARGFFNEFLHDELTEHRKVFEILGSKMKAPESDEQLSGLGFSSTQRNDVLCKVTGSFNRTLRIIF
jgi:hypothetical protein